MSNKNEARGANGYMYIQDNLDKYIKYPIKLKDASDLLYSHNEIIHLWYKSEDYNDGLISLWRGEAWALPDEYKDICILKFIGIIKDKLTGSDSIDIIVNATNSTPKNLPKKVSLKDNCSDDIPSFSNRILDKLPPLSEETEKVAKNCILNSPYLMHDYYRINNEKNKDRESLVYNNADQDILYKININDNEFLIMNKDGQCFFEDSSGIYSSKIIDKIVKELIYAKISE